MENNVNSQEIVIKNYSYLFNIFHPLLILIAVIGVLTIWKYIKIMALAGGEVKVTFYIALVLLFFLGQITYQKIRGFLKQAPTFAVTTDSIKIDSFINDYKYRNIIEKKINQISSIQYILNSEVPHQYGKVKNASIFKKLFKTDIGDMFIYIVIYFLSLIMFLMSLPVKVLILLRNKESLALLRKNFFIKFDDETALIINIYNQDDYENLLKIFKKNNIEINNKLKLLTIIKKEE